MSLQSAAPSLFTRRFSYAGSEVGGQLIFCVVTNYLLKFYTDVYGITAAAAATILLLARLVDAIDAPAWGVVFDRTSSRWGKSRPWFLWLCVPFGIFGVLTFVTPHLGHHAKIAYAACTYVLCSVLYTGINTPVTSILSALSPDSHERITLTSFRMVGSKLGVLLVNLSVLRLVSRWGHGDDRHGFLLVMPMYAVCSVVLYLLAFRNLPESVPQPREGLPARGGLRALRGNGPWWIIFVSSLFFWIAFIARITVTPFFFEYLLHRRDLISTAFALDFVSLGTILFLPWFCRRTSKRNVWAISLAASVVAQLIVYAGVGSASLPLVMTGWVAGFLASGVAMAMPFSLLSDSVDYGEWKTGVRAAGLLTAIGAAFCLKAGAGVGAALPGYILSRTHYVPNAAQTVQALGGISFSMVWLPAIAYALALVPVLFYHRFERHEGRVRDELALRRSLGAAMSAST